MRQKGVAGERWCHRHRWLVQVLPPAPVRVPRKRCMQQGRGSVTRQPRPVKGAEPILRFSDKVGGGRHPLSQIADPNMERLAGAASTFHPPAFLTFQTRQIPNKFSSYSWQLTLHCTSLHPLHIEWISRPASCSNGRLASSWLRSPPGPTVQAGQLGFKTKEPRTKESGGWAAEVRDDPQGRALQQGSRRHRRRPVPPARGRCEAKVWKMRVPGPTLQPTQLQQGSEDKKWNLHAVWSLPLDCPDSGRVYSFN